MSILLRVYPGDAWAFLIANVLVQITVVILAAWILARLGSRWNAALRHSIYLVALLCVLASPVLSWAMQATGLALLTLRPPAPTALLTEPADISPTSIPEFSSLSAPPSPQVMASRVPIKLGSLGEGLLAENPSPVSLVDVLRAITAATLLAWLLGSVWLMVRWCHGLHLIAALRRAAEPLDGTSMTELLNPVRRALGVERLPPIATCADLDRPIMVGLIRPLVILPEHVLRTLREPELADILVHECAHAACRHQVVGVLQRLAGMLFWPHPLVHLLNRELARAREEVCDNYVLRRSDAPRYARMLLELSQLLVDVPAKPAALGLFPCRWRLEDRVADLLDRRRRAMVRVNRWAAVALTATFLLLGLLIAGTRATAAAPIEEKLAEDGRQDKASAAPAHLSSSQEPSSQVAPPQETKPRPTTDDRRGEKGPPEYAAQDGERAIAAGLNWLHRHQTAAGNWRIDHRSQCKGGGCPSPGSAKSDAGATAMALLPFLAAGQTPKSPGPYRETVAKGIAWLMERQMPDGELSHRCEEPDFAQALATIALCEASAATGNVNIAKAARLAVSYVERTQNHSSFGWQFLALKSAQLAGLPVKALTLNSAQPWLDSLTKGNRLDLDTFEPKKDVTPFKVAQGLLVRQFLGASLQDPVLLEGKSYLLKDPPDSTQVHNTRFWFWGALALHRFAGPDRETWNRRLRRGLLETQFKEGCAAGSWDPHKPTLDQGGDYCGRVMTTSFSLLCLEVYYRYLLLFRETKDAVGDSQKTGAHEGAMQKSASAGESKLTSVAEKLRADKVPAAPLVGKSIARPAMAGADNKSGWKVLRCVSSEGTGYTYMESKYVDRRDIYVHLPGYEFWPPRSMLDLSAEQRKKLNDAQLAHWSRQMQFYMKAQASPSSQRPPAAYSQWLEAEKPLVRKQVEEILTPQQVQELHEFAFRSRAFLRLNDARRSELGLTAQQNTHWLSLTTAMDRRFQELPDKMLAVLTPRQRVLFREELLGPFGTVHSEEAIVQLESQAEPLRVVTLHPFPDFGKEELQRQLHLTTSQQKQVRHILGDSPDARDKLIQELIKLPPDERRKLSDDVERGVRHAVATASASKMSAEEAEKREIQLRKTSRDQRATDKKEWEQRSLVTAAISLRKQFEALLTPEQLITYQEMAVRANALNTLYDVVMWEQIGASEEQKLELSRIVNQESTAGFMEAKHQSVGKMLEMLKPAQRTKLRETVEQELRGVLQPVPPSFSHRLAPGESPGAKCA